jgi:hypothetical protein
MNFNPKTVCNSLLIVYQKITFGTVDYTVRRVEFEYRYMYEVA